MARACVTDKSSYFPNATLYFSYQACNSWFAGNSWVGLCECTGNEGASDGSSYRGDIGGQNLGLEGVRGCKSWDGLEPYCQTGGSSAGSDWCSDDWCYVDPTRCDKPVYKSSYFPNHESDLYFSYSGCNQSFTGNTWVGVNSEPTWDGCACIDNGGAAAGSTYNASIGNLCLAWDGQESYCLTGGSSAGSDWCADDWCYGAPANRTALKNVPSTRALAHAVAPA